MINVYHIIDKTFNSGAYSQLRYLHNTFKDYHNEEIKQHILLFNTSGKSKIDKNFDLPFRVVSINELKNIRYEKSSIFLYHKLMCSPCNYVVSSLKSINIPVIVLNHTFSINKKFMNVGSPHACISVSKHMDKNLVKQTSSCKIFKVIHNWCDAAFIDSIPVIKYEKNNKEFLFGRVNGFNDIKYNKHFMKWFLNANFGLPARLQYIGSGHKMQHAKDLLLNHNDSARNKIELLGQINDDSVKLSRVKSWDAFLYNINMPEGTSMSVVESLVCGTPVICDLPGNTELIQDNCNGYVYNSFMEAENFIRNIGLDGFANLKISTMEHSSKQSAKSWGQKYIDVFVEVLNTSFNIKDRDKSNIVKPIIDIKKPMIDIKKPKNNTSNKSNIIIPDTKKTNHQNEHKPSKKIKVKSPIKSNKFNFPIKNLSKVHIKTNPRVITRLIRKEDVIQASSYNQSDNQKFSILTASFNNDKYLNFYFEHILMQTYRPLEVVFIDDMSTDKTKSVVEEWKPKLLDAGIELVYKLVEHKLYCGNAYNKALELSSGDICGVLDSDDGLEPNAVNCIVDQYKKKPNALYIWSQFKICDINMNFVRNGFSSFPAMNRSLLLSEFSARKRHCFSHWRTFRKTKDIPADLFGNNLKSSIDKYMGYRLEETGVGHFLDKSLYLYRSGVKTGITHTASQRKDWTIIRRDAQRRRRTLRLFTHGFC